MTRTDRKMAAVGRLPMWVLVAVAAFAGCKSDLNQQIL